MKYSKKVMQLAGLFVASLLLVGCGAGYWDGNVKPVDPGAFDDFVLETQREVSIKSDRPRLFPERNESVSIPKGALWLGEARYPHFKRGPAQDLILALANPHPVKFDLDFNKNPIVRAPVKAVTLQDFLDSFVVQANWSYRVDDGVVIFSDWETVTIPLSPLVGLSKSTLKSTGSSGLSDSLINELVVEIDPYQEIDDIVSRIMDVRPLSAGVEGIEPDFGGGFNLPPGTQIDPVTGEILALTPEQLGGVVPEPEAPSERARTYHVSRATNSLLIAARPNTIRAVREAITYFNESSSKRVIVNLTVYDVALEAKDKRSLNLSSLRASSNLLDLSAASGSVISGVGDSLSISYGDSDVDDFDLDKILLEWISTQGAISNRVQRRFEVLNNRAVSFLDTIEVEYVKKITTTLNASPAPPTIDVEIGTHTVGRSFNLFATIVNDQASLQLTINNRNVVGTETYEFVRASGKLYNISNIDRVIPITLDNGETRVLTNFKSSDTETSLGKNKILPVIGDGVNDRSQNTESIIVISAIIL